MPLYFPEDLPGGEMVDDTDFPDKDDLQDAMIHHGYDPYSTGVDVLMGDSGMGFRYAAAMEGYNAAE